MELDAERARVKAQMGEIAQQRGDAAAVSVGAMRRRWPAGLSHRGA